MEKYAGTQAIARTFMILKLFDDKRPFHTLPSLIEASGLKRTTVFRILAALEAESVVQKTANGDYMLGAGMIALGGRAMRANHLRGVAQPFLQQMVQETGESATIDILWLDDDGVPTSLVIEERLGQHLLGMSQFIGSRFPAHTTSTGKVLLAWQPDEQHLNYRLESQTPHTITVKNELQTELQQVRKQGFAITQDELEIGLTAVSAPIFNTHGEIQAALCIGGPSSRVGGKRPFLTAAVVKHAQRISEALGYEKASSEK